jgi:hypothetical protein
MLCLGMHSYVMLRFMVQAFQDPPLCSSIIPEVGKQTFSLFIRKSQIRKFINGAAQLRL